MPDYRLGKLNGEFVVVWHDERGRHRWRLKTANPADARRKMRDFAQQRDSLRLPKKELTVKDIWDAYVAEKDAQGKQSTGRMRDAWKALGPTFADLVPDDISRALVRSYVTARRKQGISDGTIHTELGYLRAGLRLELGQRAPDIQLPSKPRPRKRHLTADEARKLIDAATMPHLRLYVLLALHTGGRPSSILDLEWNRIDFAGRKIALDNPSRDRTAKGRATVPLAPQLESALQDAAEAALTSWVIEWAGSKVASVKKGIQRAAARAGLSGVTPYVLRHTAAVWMAEQGVPMSEISQYLGHTSTAVTERVYARYSPEHLRRASDAISTVLLGSGEPRGRP